MRYVAKELDDLKRKFTIPYEIMPDGTEKRLYDVDAVDTDEGWVEEITWSGSGDFKQAVRNADGTKKITKRYGNFLVRVEELQKAG